MFKKIMSTPKGRMYTYVASALIIFLVVFIIITVSIPDKGRLRYNLKPDGTYEVTDIKDLYRGGIFMKKKLVIPSEYDGKKVTSVAKIESYDIEEIVLPDTITSIMSGSFIKMESLKKINIPEGVKKIGSKAFANCSSLTEIALPESLTEIGESAFYSCLSLETVTIPAGVKKIGSYAFSGCIKLDKVSLDFNTTEIGSNVFTDTAYIEKIYQANDNFFIVNNVLYGIKIDEAKVEGSKSSGYKIVIPEGVKEINTGVFEEELAVAVVYMPKSLEKIRSKAFSLNDPFGKNKIKFIVFKNTTFTVEDDSFVDCTSLKQIAYELDKEEIDTTSLKGSSIEKVIVVYMKDGKFYRDCKLEKNSEDLTTLEYDVEELKPFRLVDGKKEYFNEASYKFEAAK